MEKKLTIYREKLIIQNIFMALGAGALLAVQFIKVEPSYTGALLPGPPPGSA